MPKSVLVVDDDLQLVELVSSVLISRGYAVLTALDGRKAVQVCRNATVDLLITDLIMPEQEGVETISILKHDFPELKILAISGFGGLYLRMAALLGAHAILHKPFEPDELIQTVERLVGTAADRAGGGAQT